MDISTKFRIQCYDTELKIKKHILKGVIKNQEARFDDDPSALLEILLKQDVKNDESEIFVEESTINESLSEDDDLEKPTKKSVDIVIPKIIECKKCKLKFDSLYKSLLHVKQKCKDLIDCKNCDKVFATNEHLKRHIKIYHKPEITVCQYCQKIFKNDRNLSKHYKEVHKKEKNYFCGICGKGFFSISPLKVHEESHKTLKERKAAAKIAAKIAEQRAKLPTSKTRFCEYCGKTFYKLHQYYGHLRNHNKNTKGESIKKKCTYPSCNFIGVNAHLEMHYRVHTGEKPYSCNHCISTFRTTSQLTKHTKLVHLKERNYECEICGKRLSCKANYDCHIRRHNDDRPYACSQCPEKFFEHRPLKRHRAKCHPEEVLQEEHEKKLLVGQDETENI